MDENKKVDEKEAAALNEESSSVSEAVHTDSAEQAEVSKSSEQNFSQADEKVLAEKEKSSDEKADESADHGEVSAAHADELETVDENDVSDVGFECALTTADNPFDPLQNFDEWFQFDELKGYHTCAYLARIINDDDEMSDEERAAEIERAIDEIIRYDFLNIYRKVKRKVE